MTGQNFKIALRRIVRNYKSSLLIFSGLVIGLTSCLIVYTKITYELSFDKSHTQSQNTYRVVRVTSGLEYTDDGLEYRTGVHFPFPDEIKKTIPELQNVVTMFYLFGQKIIIPTNDSTMERSYALRDGVVFTESTFFDVFDFGNSDNRWVAGEGKQVLDRPFTAVLTEEAAKKLFEDQNPIGKDIIVAGTKFTIEGVIMDFPDNTDFPFKMLLSLDTFYNNLYPGSLTDWGNLSDSYQCYVVLNKRSEPKSIEEKFRQTYSTHADGDMADRRLFKLQTLADVHKESRFGNYNNRTVSRGLLVAMTIISTFIFLIASFNYSNFFLTETLKQNKQIALKLILGSRLKSVYLQFLTESLIVTFVALIVSVQITLAVIEKYYSFIDIPSGYKPAIDLAGILFVISLLLLTGILSTVFSFLNLKVKSLSTLLKTSDPATPGKENLFGRASVILQFIVAQSVIIATLFIVKQIFFINNSDLGYVTENIIYSPLPQNQNEKLNTLEKELLALPGISKVSYSSVLPAVSTSWTSLSIFRGDEEIKIDAEIKSVDTSYMDLYAFTFLSGNNFSRYDTGSSVIVNKEFLTETGFNNVDEAIGTQIRGYGNFNGSIRGVVQDFHSGSLHNEIRPCLFINNPSSYNTVNIRLSYTEASKNRESEILPGDLDKINEIWGTVFPDQPLEYRFLSDRIEEYYKSESKALNLFLLFASITIFLCILGMTGLSLSINERKTKEIGIRKVNGARVLEILFMLNKNFVKWISFAFIFAVPVSWYGIHKWLENFAYKTELSWWIFLISGIMALIIAILTVTSQSYKAATMNPVGALRYE